MKEKIEKIIIEAQLGNISSWKAEQQVLEQMKAAFQAGKEWIWEDLEQTTTCSKWKSFEEWFAEWSQNYR